ncbi:MAG TPA: hypothetical protein VMS56_04305 [Thermoanaerobaculia bacterium]|nr:hypothetical protein [Thermoanaerobaculia bacterium]
MSWTRHGRRLLIALGAVLAAGCAAEEAPEQPGITIEGSLEEGFSDEPVTTGEAVLLDYDTDYGRRIGWRSRLDGQGRFRFDGVKWDEHVRTLELRWKREKGSDEELEPVRTELGDPRALEVAPPRKGEERQDVDLGRVKVWLPQRAKELFVLSCTGRRAVDAVPGEGKFVVFERSAGPFEVAGPWLHGKVAEGWPAERKGVVCITETTEKVGDYEVISVGDQRLEAHRTTWEVRVVLFPEGTVLEERFRADPPEKVDPSLRAGPGERSTVVKGSPVSELANWLRRLDA